MKKQDRDFLESQLKDIPSDSGLRKYRAAWFKDALFKCPKHHSIKYAWEHCYLPSLGLWPTADCLECQKAKYEHSVYLKYHNKHSCCHQEGNKESRHPCQREKGCLHSEECSNKSEEEKQAKRQHKGSSLPYRQINLASGDNLVEVLSLWSAAQVQGCAKPLSFLPLWRLLCLKLAILFLRHSARIVVICPVGGQPCRHYTTKERKTEKK